MGKRAKAQYGLSALRSMVLLKEFGILEGSKTRGFYIYSDLKEVTRPDAVFQVIDLISLLEKEFNLIVDYVVDPRQLDRALFKSRTTEEEGKTVIMQVTRIKT